MSEKRITDVISGEGIRTSRGVVLLSGTLKCLTCDNSELFEWPHQDVTPEDVEDFDTLDLLIAVAQSRNWIAQRVLNANDGKMVLFILCPICLSFFLSAQS